MTRTELTKVADGYGMTAMGAALDRLLTADGWVSPPAPERIGRRSSRPGAAYKALTRKGYAEENDNGQFRLVCDAEPVYTVRAHDAAETPLAQNVSLDEALNIHEAHGGHATIYDAAGKMACMVKLGMALGCECPECEADDVSAG